MYLCLTFMVQCTKFSLKFSSSFLHSSWASSQNNVCSHIPVPGIFKQYMTLSFFITLALLLFIYLGIMFVSWVQCLNPAPGLFLFQLFSLLLSAQSFDIYIETELQLIFQGGPAEKEIEQILMFSHFQSLRPFESQLKGEKAKTRCATLYDKHNLHKTLQPADHR